MTSGLVGKELDQEVNKLKKKLLLNVLVHLTICSILGLPINSFATESNASEVVATPSGLLETEQTESISLGDYEELINDLKKEEIISLELPLTDGMSPSPFDFIMDPQGLIEATDAARYGGTRFEEGATIYFENTTGEYDYSHQSDFLEVISHSTIPIRITVEARVENLNPSVYLALIDNHGNEIPVDLDGTAVIDTELDACEDTASYNTYAFALTGTCESDAEWSNVSEQPYVTVTWTLEPITDENPSESTLEPSDDGINK